MRLWCVRHRRSRLTWRLVDMHEYVLNLRDRERTNIRAVYESGVYTSSERASFTDNWTVTLTRWCGLLGSTICRPHTYIHLYDTITSTPHHSVTYRKPLCRDITRSLAVANTLRDALFVGYQVSVATIRRACAKNSQAKAVLFLLTMRFWRPRWRWPRQNFAVMSPVGKLEWCGHHSGDEKKFDGNFSRLIDTIHGRDRQTDGRTDGHRTTTKTALCILSRGKQCFLSIVDCIISCDNVTDVYACSDCVISGDCVRCHPRDRQLEGGACWGHYDWNHSPRHYRASTTSAQSILPFTHI